MRGGATRWACEFLLNIAAVGGAASILITLAAVVLQVNLILFKTGSMAPAIPAGSVAIVRQVPAVNVLPGDVVTVDRPGKLPVTHRVVAVQPAPGGTGEAAVLRLKGDANVAEDPESYTVTSVRTVLWSAPGLAPAIVAASTPLTMGTTTLAVTCLVTLSLWPRQTEAAGQSAGSAGGVVHAGGG